MTPLPAVAIYDLSPGGFLAVDLIDILRLCEPQALASTWRVSKVECVGTLMQELEQLSNQNATVSGAEVMRLAAGVHHIIWGDFEACLPGENQFWLVVRAIDSTFYVVITSDAGLLEQVRRTFKDVRLSSEDAEHPDAP